MVSQALGLGPRTPVDGEVAKVSELAAEESTMGSVLDEAVRPQGWFARLKRRLAGKPGSGSDGGISAPDADLDDAAAIGGIGDCSDSGDSVGGGGDGASD